TNQLGTVRGQDQTLTTAPLPPPALAPGPASAVTPTSVTLSGSATPNGLATAAHFDWGTTTAYGSRTADQALRARTSAQGLSAALSGLEPGTTYHFRLVAGDETRTS